jgi:ankyrin repeat protein
MEYHQIHEIVRIDLINKLIDEGYNPNAYDSYGLTPLHYCEDPIIAEFLIKKGANPYQKSKDSYSLSPVESCENIMVMNVFNNYSYKNTDLD